MEQVSLPGAIVVRPLRVAVLHAADLSNLTLSYQRGFPQAFAHHRRFQSILINVMDQGGITAFAAWRALKLERLDAVILLHSVFSNACKLGGRLRDWVAACRAPKVLFLGNEYKLMPEKMAFAEEIGASVLVTQFNAPEPIALYRERLGIPVVHVPNAAVDPALFRPGPRLEERPIDIGYRAYNTPWYVGHNERRRTAEAFREAASRRRLAADISIGPSDRMAPPDWAAFLARCKAQIGTEAGGDYFELTDGVRKAVNAYLNENPTATFEEVHQHFFARYVGAVPGRIISSRNAEAAATKTVQILLDGAYGGYLEPDVHYISVCKDFSTMDEALDRLDDVSYCAQIADNAYERVMGVLTFDRVLAAFHDNLRRLI